MARTAAAMPTRSSLQGRLKAAYFHVRPKASRSRIEYGLIAAGIAVAISVAHDVVVRLHLGRPRRRETATVHRAGQHLRSDDSQGMATRRGSLVSRIERAGYMRGLKRRRINRHLWGSD